MTSQMLRHTRYLRDINLSATYPELIQNTIAPVVTGTNRSQHITPILQQLHWLPIQSRTDYKIAIITFKTLKTGTSVYLANLLQLNSSSAAGCKSTTVVLVQLLLPFGTVYHQNLHQTLIQWNSTHSNATLRRISSKNISI